VRQADVADLGARRLHPADALLPQGFDLGRHAVDPVFRWDADAETLAVVSQ
jgi:hypothetical protein